MTALAVALCLICDKTTVQVGGRMVHATRTDDEICDAIAAGDFPTPAAARAAISAPED